MPKFLAPLDLTRSELRNAVTQNLASAPAAPLPGLRYYDTVLNVERYWDGTKWVDVSSTWVPPSGDIDMGGNKIINLGGPPVAGTDAANKAYVDSVATGLDVKNAVRAASTANVTISGPGATIDGVALTAGDRVLLKNQTTPSQNGIYVWNGAAVAMTRAPDADASAEVTNGMFCLATAGTTQAGTGWLLTTPDPIVLDTTGLTFTQFSASTSYVGTANRITVVGNVIDIAATYAGQASITTLGTIATGTWQGTPVGLAYGGTGATTAAAARANLGVPGKYATSIGNGTASYDVVHGLATEDVIVRTYDNTKAEVYVDVTIVDANTVRLAGFTTNPTAGTQIRVVVLG